MVNIGVLYCATGAIEIRINTPSLYFNLYKNKVEVGVAVDAKKNSEKHQKSASFECNCWIFHINLNNMMFYI